MAALLPLAGGCAAVAAVAARGAGAACAAAEAEAALLPALGTAAPVAGNLFLLRFAFFVLMAGREAEEQTECASHALRARPTKREGAAVARKTQWDHLDISYKFQMLQCTMSHISCCIVCCPKECLTLPSNQSAVSVCVALSALLRSVVSMCSLCKTDQCSLQLFCSSTAPTRWALPVLTRSQSCRRCTLLRWHGADLTGSSPSHFSELKQCLSAESGGEAWQEHVEAQLECMRTAATWCSSTSRIGSLR